MAFDITQSGAPDASASSPMQTLPVPGVQQPGVNPTAQVDDKTKQILQMLLQTAQRKQFAGTPIPNVPQDVSTLPPPQYAGHPRQQSFYTIGALIRNGINQEKKNQLLKAEGDWTYLQAGINEMQAAQQSGNPQAIQAAQQKLNVVLADPKKLKNMAKALNQDWLNPEKTTVYGEALKNVIAQQGKKDQAQQGLKGMIMKLLGQKQALQRQAAMNSLTPEQRQQMAREIESKAPTQTAGLDPKMMTELLNQARLEQQHQENLAERKLEHEENLAQRKKAEEDTNQIKLGQIETQRMVLQQRADDQKLNREQRDQIHKDNVYLREQEMALRKQIAEGSGNAEDWANVIRRGGKLSDIPAKERTGVVSYMEKNNIAIPKPLSTAEQKNMDDVLETINKVDGWQQDLQKFVDPKTGKLSNKPFTMLSGTLAYKFGVNTPESAMISDFSRERWQAIAPLLHGIRRGDIIQDIVKHTPDPMKDSPELMATKLQQLKKNYGEARTAILQSHGFDIDPTTGEQIGKMGEIHYKIVNGTLVPDTQSNAPK